CTGATANHASGAERCCDRPTLSRGASPSGAPHARSERVSRARRSRSASAAIETRVESLLEQVKAGVRQRPGVYRMVSPDGEILYVGKAKNLRTRLLGYFRAAFPAEKSARIIREAGE